MKIYENMKTTVRPTSEADVSVIVKAAKDANMPISVRRWTAEKVWNILSAMYIKHWNTNIEHSNREKQWRAQLHMHKHQAGLRAHRHEGDGLHRVDTGEE